MGKVIQAAWMFQAKRFLKNSSTSIPPSVPLCPSLLPGCTVIPGLNYQDYLEMNMKYNASSYPQLDAAIEKHPIQHIIKTIMDEPPKSA